MTLVWYNNSDPQSDGILPESLPTWFTRTVKNNANLPALKVKRNERWMTWTYAQYYDDVRTAAKAFIHLGLEPYHAVGIIGFNSPEWFISDIAAIYAG
jgi:long-chain-fatty-acid--CoA ligase ACSBG